MTDIDNNAALWDALRKPFAADSISLLPRATGPVENRHKQKCPECGGYHDFPCIHLSYVGHADITMRLNEVDPTWTWTPMGFDEHGLPALDKSGCLWAWLTILGVTKPAYGDPGLDYKNKSKAGTPDGMKEAIGDMLRNGAMRFGVGTELWSKSDRAKNALHSEDADDGNSASAPAKQPSLRDRFDALMTVADLKENKDAVAEKLGNPKTKGSAIAAFTVLSEDARKELEDIAENGVYASEPIPF